MASEDQLPSSSPSLGTVGTQLHLPCGGAAEGLLFAAPFLLPTIGLLSESVSFSIQKDWSVRCDVTGRITKRYIYIHTHDIDCLRGRFLAAWQSCIFFEGVAANDWVRDLTMKFHRPAAHLLCCTAMSFHLRRPIIVVIQSWPTPKWRWKWEMGMGSTQNIAT